MQVDFDDEHKIAAYYLTYEENQDPDKMRKIDEDLLQKGKNGYLVGIAASSSPQPLTWSEFVMAMESLDKRMDIWKYDQECKKKAEKETAKEENDEYLLLHFHGSKGQWHMGLHQRHDDQNDTRCTSHHSAHIPYRCTAAF